MYKSDRFSLSKNFSNLMKWIGLPRRAHKPEPQAKVIGGGSSTFSWDCNHASV